MPGNRLQSAVIEAAKNGNLGELERLADTVDDFSFVMPVPSQKDRNPLQVALRYKRNDWVRCASYLAQRLINYVNQAIPTDLSERARGELMANIERVKSWAGYQDSDQKTLWHYLVIPGKDNDSPEKTYQVFQALKLQLSGTTWWSHFKLKDAEGYSAASLIARYGHVELFCEVMSQDDLAQSFYQKQALLNLATRKGHLDIIKAWRLRLHRGFDKKVDFDKNTHQTVAHYAALYGHLKILEYVVSCHLELASVKDTNQMSPVLLAAEAGHVNILKALINWGQSALTTDKDRNSLLHFAVRSSYQQDKQFPRSSAEGYADTVQYLLSTYPDLRLTVNRSGRTPLLEAAMAGQSNAMLLILEQDMGALAIADTKGFRVLHYLVSHGHLDALKELESRYDLKEAVTVCSNDGANLLHLAITSTMMSPRQKECMVHHMATSPLYRVLRDQAPSRKESKIKAVARRITGFIGKTPVKLAESLAKRARGDALLQTIVRYLKPENVDAVPPLSFDAATEAVNRVQRYAANHFVDLCFVERGDIDLREPIASIPKDDEGEFFKAYMHDPDFEDDQRVTIKVVNLQAMPQVDELDALRRELSVLTSIRHPYIAPLEAYSVYEEAGAAKCALILSDDIDTSLQALLANNDNKQAMTADHCLTFAMDVAEALAALHDIRVLHRDLRPSNILVTPDWRVRLFGFRRSKMNEYSMSATATMNLDKADERSQLCEKIAYSASEVLPAFEHKHARYSAKSDVYSFGVLLWELMHMQHPYDAAGEQDAFAYLKQQLDSASRSRLPMLSPVRTSTESVSATLQRLGFATLMSECLHTLPQQRPTMTDVVGRLQAMLENRQPEPLDQHYTEYAAEANFSENVVVEPTQGSDAATGFGPAGLFASQPPASPTPAERGQVEVSGASAAAGGAA